MKPLPSRRDLRVLSAEGTDYEVALVIPVSASSPHEAMLLAWDKLTGGIIDRVEDASSRNTHVHRLRRLKEDLTVG